ncbi:MAG: type III-B CRISPR module RAMP protein Cmr1, partial [Gammaproteobacteria bacterium]
MATEIRFLARRARTAFPGDAQGLRNRLSDKDPPRAVAAAETLKYKVELITPLFGGGVEPGVNDPQLPVRMKALRGQLRFWWRLLAAYGGFQDCGLSALINGSVLYEAETARWGGAGENGKPIPGRIGLRALNPHGFDDTGKYGTAPQFREPTRAIDYSLFPAKRGEQDGNDAKTLILPKEWVGQNKDVSCFTLEISVNAGDAPKASQIAQELRCTVAWWATFGGIGARWRRGVGSVRVCDEKNNLLCVLDDDP